MLDERVRILVEENTEQGDDCDLYGCQRDDGDHPDARAEGEG